MGGILSGFLEIAGERNYYLKSWYTFRWEQNCWAEKLWKQHLDPKNLDNMLAALCD